MLFIEANWGPKRRAGKLMKEESRQQKRTRSSDEAAGMAAAEQQDECATRKQNAQTDTDAEGGIIIRYKKRTNDMPATKSN